MIVSTNDSKARYNNPCGGIQEGAIDDRHVGTRHDGNAHENTNNLEDWLLVVVVRDRPTLKAMYDVIRKRIVLCVDLVIIMEGMGVDMSQAVRNSQPIPSVGLEILFPTKDGEEKCVEDKKGGGIIVWKDSIRKNIPNEHSWDQCGEEVGDELHVDADDCCWYV